MNRYFILATIFAAGTAIAGDDPAQSSRGIPVANSPKQSASAITSYTLPSKADKESKMKSLSLTGLDGVAHSLSDWKGKVIVINFWATWCSPCLYEIPSFVTYQEEYQARGLQIIGVGLDEVRKLRNVQRSLEINYPVLVADPAVYGGLMERWGNSSGVVPYSVVIGQDGQVKHTHHGLLSREDFDEFVMPLLDKG